MPLNFDIKNTTVTEFGVGREGQDGWIFSLVPVDEGAQGALEEMAAVTWDAMQDADGDPPEYQPSEKYGGTEYVYLMEGDDLETTARELYDAHNLPIDTHALHDPNEVGCYFARFVDDKGRHLIGLRRAGYFKGILKKCLLRVLDDSLRVVEDRVFKLDTDFDFLIDSDHTHIWRPRSFEFVSNLKEAILGAVPTNVALIQRDMPFLDFDSIREYASTHTRAAGYLASICKQDVSGIERKALIKLCKDTDVQVDEVNGSIKVRKEDVMGLLEVLDRRRYQIELVPGVEEKFRASKRREIPRP